MNKSVGSVLAQIPGWEGAEFSEMSGGLNNLSWFVEAGSRKAVLKVDEHPRGAPFNTRAAEARIQTQAAQAGLAGAVLFASDTVFMSEYVEGSVWSGASLEDCENLDRLAAALRTLHALPLTGQPFDAVSAASGYASQIKNADTENVRACLLTIEAMPLPVKLCCCHNDLVAANIIATPDIRFLDWEYACDNDPLFDLATVVAHHNLSAARSDYLLNAYFDGDGQRWREQLERQSELYESLRWLWQAARSGRGMG
jgi:thiamine kinase-like enzyme